MLRVLIIFLLSLQYLSGQNLFKQNTLRYGIKIGANFAHIVGADDDGMFTEEHSKFGPALGVTAEKELGRLLSLQGEILYNDVGSKWQQPLLGIGYDGNYAIYYLKYISVPLYLKIRNDLGAFLDNFELIAGAAYSYNISAKQKVVIESDGYTPDYGPLNIRNDINRNEYGILFGINIPYNKKKRKINITVQFYWALTNLYKSDAKTYPEGLQNLGQLKNRNLSINFEYFFN